jgi:glyoxylase-like metal-dependent hydrolase (beta-lactamase superfamily II)
MSNNPRQVADGVLFLRTMIVNVYIVRTPATWVLVDAGLPGYAGAIQKAARSFVGSSAPPAAIVLTHGHFDHVGSLEALLKEWNVPVLAHPLEMPYLTGRAKYPPPDPLAGGGAMTLMSRLFSRGPIDVSAHVRPLEEGNSVPGMEGWRWLATPGHSPGHLSLFRDSDRTLIAGDAVTTTQQESLIAVATQRREVHGPPAYFTPDWDSAGESAGRIAALEPEVLATGHGDPLRGAEMRAALRRLASHFDDAAVPSIGRYSRMPAITDERGVVSVPPDPLPKVLAGAAVAAGLTAGLVLQRRRAS